VAHLSLNPNKSSLKSHQSRLDTTTAAVNGTGNSVQAEVTEILKARSLQTKAHD
jgi:hypothetical protein